MSNSRAMMFNTYQPQLGVSEFADTPEGKLATAVIKAALLDQARFTRRLRSITPLQRQFARDAVEERLECLKEFFEESDPVPLNLAWCCFLLYENGEEMRRYICKLWRQMRYVEGH